MTSQEYTQWLKGFLDAVDNYAITKKQFDSILLCGGAERPRDLLVEGRELEGIHFAMDFLAQQNRRNGNELLNRTKFPPKVNM